MESQEHHPFAVRLDGRTSYLIWAGGMEEDRVLADGDVALVFQDLEDLRRYGKEHGLPLVDSIVGVVDLDAVMEWLDSHQRPDAALLLAAWNLCWDVATGTGRSFHHRDPEHNRIYDKLFWANNLPAVTPAGAHYEPEWTDTEGARLREFFDDAVELVRSALQA